MDFAKRANKYKRRSSTIADIEDRDILGVVQIDDTLMNLFCSYSLSQNTSIHKHGLVSLHKLLSYITESYFRTNQTLALKYKFCMEILTNRIKGIQHRDILLSAANKVVDVDVLTKDGSITREISNDEVEYIEMTVGEIQNNLYLNIHMKDLKDLWNRYETSDFRMKRTILPEIRKAASGLLTQFRRNDANQDSSDTLFRLSDMENGVEDIHKQVTSPSFKLVTGMKGLNDMLGGGVEPGNVYSFFGLPGEGKTVTLENLLYQLWKYNRGYQCRDKTKKPCIVLLTMENFVRQTVCALYHILTKGKNLRDCATAQEAIEEFKKHSFEFNGEEGSIEIVIKFKPINSVTTEYMYKLVEDLEDEGFECIAFLQDYVKRILPSIQTNDPYQDLGNVINDFKTFATLKKLPVITASQLNREAARMIDEGRNANKLDLIKKLGRSNIGESSRIDENLDGTFIITPELSADGKKFMGIKLTKHRYEIYTKVMSIYQPFYETSQIALYEDLYESKPAYRESLLKDSEEIRQSFGEVERVSINKTVKSLEFLNNNTADMLKPGVSGIEEKVVIKRKESNSTHSMKSLIPKKEVMTIIDLKDVEKYRSKYGIKNVLKRA